MKKIYWLIRLTQQSPLRISDGDNEETDSDLMRDGRGLPYIPGSSLAGVLRSMLPREEAERAFGYLKIGSDEITESRIIVSDASLRSGKGVRESVRDGIAVENGIVKDTGKYDFEVVECTQPYEAVLETEDDDRVLYRLAACVKRDGGISFGARTTRGYGRMSAEFRRKVFDLSDAAGMSEWLDYDPFRAEAFDGAEPVEVSEADAPADMLHIRAAISMAGSFIIRVYSDQSAIKARTLTNGAGRAVIPGTTWAGIFRHHMLDTAAALGADCAGIADLFGSAGEEHSGKGKKRSGIIFEETVLENTASYPYRRNALDRFTMAPKYGALYTEELCSGGSGYLDILLPAGTDPLTQQLLASALLDLKNGLLHFGGEGGIGRGIVTVGSLDINGTDMADRLAKNELFLPVGKEMT